MRIFALAAFLALSAAPVQAAICHTQNLMPEFLTFEAQTEGMAPDARADLFIKAIAQRHPDYYTVEEFGDDARRHKSALRLFDPSRPIVFAGFGPLTDAHLREVAGNVMPAFDKAQADFSRAFPDFTCKADVMFGVSLLHFDGHGYNDKQGREHMRFGIDMIALLHQPQDLPAFFAHELFHIYHAQALGVHPEDDDRTWWAMWEEGLATYVSRQMNMPQTEQQVLWTPVDLAAQMDKPGVMQETAREMLADFDTTEHYAYWFSAGHSAPNLPARAGYFMGLRMAEELGRTRTLQQLAQLTPDEVKPMAKAFLEEQAR
ncbi:MAG TPA: DUF5700 domain-containing putative Zn-dependent protease [Rhizomicrobium sp.]|nr:DUF5700 domain-containing putative Zn-dependent protease [Rhizomicrobium sp.]